MSTLSPVLLLHSSDNVAVARQPLNAGQTIQLNGRELTTREAIPANHKLAIVDIEAGKLIRKFGQPIGAASEPITAGSWVHTQNVALEKSNDGYEFATEINQPAAADPPGTFLGYRRSNGSAGTRNYIAVISTVNCSATASRYVAQELTRLDLSRYENIDGILPVVHKSGCAFAWNSPDHQMLNRTLAGFAQHPNIAAAIVLGLGCETAQASHLQDSHGLVQLGGTSPETRQLPMTLNIQDVGGVRRTVERATAVLRELLPEANRVRREPIPLSELSVGLQCGGSDGASGITANPALGYACDLLVGHGGGAVLAETPEVYGAEQLLTRRAISREVAEKLLERIRWWEDYARCHSASIDNNPSWGNKQGGLTTIIEKSLGAVAKGGTSPLQDVYLYAEQVTARGLTLMDSPGYDPMSVTGLVAGGCQLIVFTTGRGSCFGCKPSPTIKVATNTPMFQRMQEDMDVNAGTILEGTSVEQVGREIFDRMIAVASGQQTLSEQQGIGDEEFCPWMPGPVF